MSATHATDSTTVTAPVLYLALELSWTSWKLAFTVGAGQKPRLRSIPARDTDALMLEIRKAKDRFGLPEEAPVISCYEAGDELVPERAKLYSRLHPRCGTSFLLVVMIVAIFVFAPIGLPAWWILVLTRIFGVPVIAGLSFEVIKFAGRNRRRRWVQLIIYPGMQLQRLTTREPDLDELAVSIASLQAVLDVEGDDAHSADDLVGVELVA